MKKISFGKEWQFSLNKGEKSTVNIPHDFSIIQERKKDAPSTASGGFFQGGYGIYEKTFKPKKGKRYFFMCDGSFGLTEVFVNANKVLDNKYPYNTFYADITEFLRYDKESVIEIRVNQTSLPNARWYTGAGVYRDVFLCECDDFYLLPFGSFVKTKEITDGTAYMSVETEFFAKEKTHARLCFEVFEAGKRTPVAKFEKLVCADQGKNKACAGFEIPNAKLWNVDSPNMYEIKVRLKVGELVDEDTAPFGVRTIQIDTKKGFLLNGKSVKLRGGCVHHDQGALGSASFLEPEYRRIAKLKEAGFNSLRCSHNPQSQHFYDACDRLGMLVIDELFDYWTEGKQENDFHAFFEDNYERWIEAIVKRNRCHPSIIMWSTGNEIPQKSGRGNGYYIARNIANKIRLIDTSRPLTHALCSLWDNKEAFELENATKDLGADKMDYFATVTEITADTVDVVGYNYLEYRLDKDLVRFPNRVFMNTETFPICAYSTIKQQLANPRILGDYVWTAWDYFGETGIGHVEYDVHRGDFLLGYPHHIANCGDIDICGYRKPQSYYREIAWGLRKDPYVAVRHPKLFKTPYFISGWGFYECDEAWCFNGYEGEDVEVYVFADCDEVSIEINGKEVGRMAKTDNGVYRFNTKYEKGELVARAFENGKAVGSYSIKTEGKATKISLEKEESHLAKSTKKPENEIVYVDVEIQDESGALCTSESRFVTYEAKGAKIVGLASGSLVTEESYKANEGKTCFGRAIVILEKNAKDATLCAKCDGLESCEIKI